MKLYYLLFMENESGIIDNYVSVAIKGVDWIVFGKGGMRLF